jgi:ribonuclease HII
MDVERLPLKKLSLKRLRQLVEEKGPAIYAQVIRELKADPRVGAQRIVQECQSRIEAMEREQGRLARMFDYERQIRAMGYRLVAGVVTVGKGALAGPVVAAAVAWADAVPIAGLEEPKKLSGRRRQEVYEQIRAQAVAVGTCAVMPGGADEESAMQAELEAMVGAVAALRPAPEYLLVDGSRTLPLSLPQAAVPRGEAVSYSIAAASVVARVARDEQLCQLDRLYPGYGFANHKGYSTPEHREALERLGPSPVHRVGIRIKGQVG